MTGKGDKSRVTNREAYQNAKLWDKRIPQKETVCEHNISVHKPCELCASNYDAAFKADKIEKDIEQEGQDNE